MKSGRMTHISEDSIGVNASYQKICDKARVIIKENACMKFCDETNDCNQNQMHLRWD